MKGSNRREFLIGMAAISLGSGNLPYILGAATKPATIKPPRLKSGDTVALVNPASAIAHRMDIEIAIESFQALGLKVKTGENLTQRRGYFAGTDQERASDLNRALQDPDVSAVVALRGGWGSARILPLVDYQAIVDSPKIILGYSDVTALLLAIYSRTGVVTFHGPVGLGPWNPFSVDYLKKVLFEGATVTFRNPRHIGSNLTQVRNRIQTLTPGKASGHLLGGNLTVLTSIVGSQYLPDWTGAILFLEDVGENIYRIDRMLTQLKLAGILDEISAFVFGKCSDCKPGEGYGSLTIEEVLEDHIKPLGIPAWRGSMIGHLAEKFTVPEGVRAEIDASTGVIRMLESAVS